MSLVKNKDVIKYFDMKKIYERGDIIELHDDIAVPFGLGASLVQLVKEESPGNWIVDIIESRADQPIKGEITINKKWFL